MINLNRPTKSHNVLLTSSFQKDGPKCHDRMSIWLSEWGLFRKSVFSVFRLLRFDFAIALGSKNWNFHARSFSGQWFRASGFGHRPTLTWEFPVSFPERRFLGNFAFVSKNTVCISRRYFQIAVGTVPKTRSEPNCYYIKHCAQH